MKMGHKSLAFPLYSFLTVLTATAVSNGAEKIGETGNSLVLSDDTHRFTEYVYSIIIFQFHKLNLVSCVNNSASRNEVTGASTLSCFFTRLYGMTE